MLLLSCGGQGGGVAPSHDEPAVPEAPVTPPSSGSSYESELKFGTIATSTNGNGWQVLMDESDNVQAQTLANGWSVEVKYDF